MSNQITSNNGFERRSHFINSNDNNFTYYENNAPTHKTRELVLTLLHMYALSEKHFPYRHSDKNGL